MQKLIFFDLDGTIINPSKRYHVIHAEICSSLGIKPFGIDEYWEYKRNKLPESELLIRCGANHFEIDGAINERSLMLEDASYLKYDTLHNEIDGVLNLLAKKNELVLITFRSKRKELEVQLKYLGIKDYFTKVLSTKPTLTPKYMGKVRLIEENYQYIDNSIFFGDTEVDILTGKYFKMTTVACNNGIRTKEILTDVNPDYFINSWDLSTWKENLRRKIWT
jgi:phosphoglycolate phosphatase-like HAD superfamily hydrolase